MDYTTVFGNDTIPPSQSGYTLLPMSSDTILYWPEISQAQYVASDIMDVDSSGIFNLFMPEASLVSQGRSVLINNIGAFSITLMDHLGAVLGAISPGQVKNLYLTDNSTPGGTWRIYTFGTGTSSADAVSLTGYGLSVIAGDLAQNSPVKIASSSTTIQQSDRAGTYVFKSSGMVTCSLLSAITVGDGYFLNVVNQGSGTVTIDPSSTETIDGLATKALAPGESTTIVCDGTNWVTVGYGRSTQFQFTKLVLDITTGSPFNLTSTQAENKLLQLIGAPTAAVTINLPAVVAVYYIECSYSGAFFTTIKTAAGTGVTVKGTDRIIAYCDGINVVFAQTSGLPATSISAGTAGAVVYQVALDATGFTDVGVAGDLLRSAGTGKPYFQAPAEFVVTKTSVTGSAVMPVGTTLQRDSTPQTGYSRYNSTFNKTEYWNGTAWVLGGGATGGGSDDVFYENSIHVTTNYSISSGKNAMSAGPITIDNGVSVTVPNGSVWSIV